MTLLSTAATIATTALASGSIAAILTHFLTANRERRSLLRQKAEDLYVSVEAWENSWGLTLVSLQGVVLGKIHYNDHLDVLIEQGKLTDGALNRRVHMLTEIYFPTAGKNLKEVLLALESFNKISAIHKAAWNAGKFDAFEWNKDFAPPLKEVTLAFDRYRNAVVRCAQSSFKPLKLRA